jgi:hypothetical protein
MKKLVDKTLIEIDTFSTTGSGNPVYTTCNSLMNAASFKCCAKFYCI